MLEQEQYVKEKLREIESGRIVLLPEEVPHKPALASVARPIGRALHRLGHRMESWATPSHDHEVLRPHGRTQ
jgi:hypothetical protein